MKKENNVQSFYRIIIVAAACFFVCFFFFFYYLSLVFPWRGSSGLGVYDLYFNVRARCRCLSARIGTSHSLTTGEHYTWNLSVVAYRVVENRLVINVKFPASLEMTRRSESPPSCLDRNEARLGPSLPYPAQLQKRTTDNFLYLRQLVSYFPVLISSFVYAFAWFVLQLFFFSPILIIRLWRKKRKENIVMVMKFVPWSSSHTSDCDLETKKTEVNVCGGYFAGSFFTGHLNFPSFLSDEKKEAIDCVQNCIFFFFFSFASPFL